MSFLGFSMEKRRLRSFKVKYPYWRLYCALSSLSHALAGFLMVYRLGIK